MYRIMKFGVIAAVLAISAVGAQAQQGKDIVETAVAAGSFKTLAKALEAADLVDTLKGTGPYTVFAPTDEAFAKLSPATLNDLLKPENRAKLKRILTYHVVAGRVSSADVVKKDSATAVSGDAIRIKSSDGAVMVNNARVVKVDIAASNGIIHVIDTVMLPGDTR